MGSSNKICKIVRIVFWIIWPLLGSGFIKHVPAETNRRGSPLEANGSPNTFPWQWIKQSNARTIGDGDLYSVRLEAGSVQEDEEVTDS
jgi:hypothetical protein